MNVPNFMLCSIVVNYYLPQYVLYPKDSKIGMAWTRG